MRAGHSRCHPDDAHMPRLMHEGLGWCCMPLADVICQMRTYHGWCVQALADVACQWPMRGSHGRWRPSNAHAPRLKRADLGWCCMPLFDVVCQIRTCDVRCVQALADAACRWGTSPSRCAQATAVVSSRCSHTKVDVCRPWAMSPVVGRCAQATDDVAQSMRAWHDWCMQAVGRCRLPDAHTPHLMRACLGRCRLPLADVACCWPMYAGHDLWRPANAHTTRLMLLGLGLCYMALANVICQMRTCHVWCVHSFVDAAFRWPTLLARCAHATSDALSTWALDSVARILT